MSRFSKFRVLGVAVLLAATLAAQRASTAGSSPNSSEHSMGLVVQNHYYAKPRKVDEVYQWRLHASDVRARLGLAREADIARLDASGEFVPVERHMQDLIRGSTT